VGLAGRLLALGIVCGACGSRALVAPDGASSDLAAPAACADAYSLDHWAVSIELPTACAARPPAACSSAAGTPDDEVTAEVVKIALLECRLPQLVMLRVAVVGGCPTTFDLSSSSGSPDLVACLERALGSVRWTCADDSSCVLYEYDTI
jgi:hypothetical protein